MGSPKLGMQAVANDFEADLQEPLLTAQTSIEDVPSGSRRTVFLTCVFNFVKVLLGAGMLALPRAVDLLGCGVGLSLLALVCALAFFTLAALVYGSDVTKTDSYAALMRTAFGPGAETALQVIMFFGCIGGEVVYMDIVTDILLGDAPSYQGVLTSLFPPELRTVWYLSRPFIMALVLGLVLLPLMSMRRMERLSLVNVVGIGSLVVLTGGFVVLAGVAAYQGKGHWPPLAPDFEALGKTASQQAVAITNVIPVILTATAVHQSVHPLRRMVVPYDRKLLYGVLATSLTFVTALWTVLCVTAFVVFGETIKDDFLNNVTTEALAPLMGGPAAVVFSYLVRLGYAASLVGSAVLLMFPLREVAVGLLSRDPSAVDRWFHAATCALMALAYLGATCLTSIWTVNSIVGCVAATGLCFVLPGMVTLKYNKPTGPGQALSGTQRAQRALAWAVVVLGVALFANGAASVALSL